MVARASGEREWAITANGCGCGLSFGSDENVVELHRGDGYDNIINVLNATESFTLKWLILFYVNFTSIFFFKKKG